MDAIISSPRRKSLTSLSLSLSLSLSHTHTHTHTHSQAGYVSLKMTISFRCRVQKLLPDWKRWVFYARFYSGYMEQETLSSHMSFFNFGSITTALRGSLHYTPIRRWFALNGYSHSENRPAMPDLLSTAHFNNPDIQAAVWICLCDTLNMCSSLNTHLTNKYIPCR
jgi:hypothetical protein